VRSPQDAGAVLPQPIVIEKNAGRG